MDEQAKLHLIEKLQKVARTVKSVEFILWDSDAVKSISRDGVEFTFDEKTLNEFEDIVRCLLQSNRWSDKYSESFLENALEGIIAQVLRTGAFEKIPDYFNALCASYEKYDTEHLVLLPLGGFKMELDSVEIGHLVFRKIVREAAPAPQGQQARLEIKIVGLELTDAQRKLFFRDAREGMICAEYRIVAEPRRAAERGEEECNRVLELLRFAIPALFADYLRVEIGYMWEIVNVRGSLLTLQAAKPGYHSQARAIGPAAPFELTDATVKELERIGVFKVAKVLKKEPSTLTEFEKIMLRALHWFGTSVSQPDIENKFLNFLICLEALLNPRSGDPITNAIAEGVAFILGDNFENRSWLKNRVKYLYGIRSGLSHGGQKEILEIDLHHLREIAGRMLTWVIKKTDEFHSQKALLAWIEQQKLT